MAKKLLATIAVLATFVAMVSLSVLALFTDTAQVQNSTFSTGTIDIDLSDSDETDADDLTTSDITFADMAPGDQVVAPITVKNNGSLDLRYAVTSTTTENALAADLDLTIWDEAEEADAGTDCNSSAPATVLYGPADLGSTTGIDVIGDPAQGSQAGDRTLAAAVTEVLCFKVALPLSATVQGTTTATFDFQAEQTKNNP